MRLKSFGALALAGAMLAGTLGVAEPAVVMAGEASGGTSSGVSAPNTYTLTVPENMDNLQNGWNSLGNITVTKAGGTFDTEKNVTVTAASANDFRLISSEGGKISYTLQTSEDAGQPQTTFEFNGAAIADDKASQDVGVQVDIGDQAKAGTYTDTLTFEAKMSGGSTGGDEENPDDPADISDLFEKHLPVTFILKDGTSIEMRYVSDRENYAPSDYNGAGYYSDDAYLFTHWDENDNKNHRFDVTIDKEGNVTFDDTDPGNLASIKINGKTLWTNSSSGGSENPDIENLFTNHVPVEFGLKAGGKIVTKYKSDMGDYDVDKTETTVSNLEMWNGGIREGEFHYIFYIDSDEVNITISNTGEVTGDTDKFSYIKIGDKLFWGTEPAGGSDNPGEPDDKTDLSKFTQFQFNMTTRENSTVQLCFLDREGKAVEIISGWNDYPADYQKYFNGNYKLSVDSNTLTATFDNITVEADVSAKTFKVTGAPDGMIETLEITGYTEGYYLGDGESLGSFTKVTSGGESGGDTDWTDKNVKLTYTVDGAEGWTEVRIFKADDTTYSINELAADKIFQYAGLNGSVDKSKNTLTIIFVDTASDSSITLTFDFNNHTYTMDNEMGIEFESPKLTIDGATYEFDSSSQF